MSGEEKDGEINIQPKIKQNFDYIIKRVKGKDIIKLPT